MNYIKYSRNMIMLEDQGSEFSANDGPVKGHLKVETGNNKGAMRCSVHNLKPYPKGDYIYKLIFFGKDEERTIHAVIGNLILNRNGSGETYFRFSPLDTDGKGNDYSQFTTAIIAAVSSSDDQEPLHPVLKGLTGNQPTQRRPQTARPEQRKSSSFEQMASAASVSANKEELESEAPGKIPVWETGQAVAAAQENTAQESTAQKPATTQTTQERAPLSAEEMLRIKREREPKEMSHPLEKEDEPARAPVPQSSGKSPKCYNSFYNEYILHACNHACQSAEFYEEVVPFTNDITGARWKKIMNVGNLPLVSPGAQHYAHQYHHYLFGAKADEKGYACRFYYAVPGRNMASEKPDGGKSGFTCWQPVKGEENKENGYGYWIVSIDAATGNIEEVI